MASNSLIELEIAAGNSTEAASLADRVDPILGDSLSPEVQVNLRVAQATAYRLVGRLDEALASAEQAVLVSETTPDSPHLALACIILSSCLSKAGAQKEARVQLSRASQSVAGVDRNASELRMLEVTTATIELLEAERAADDGSTGVEAALKTVQGQLAAWDPLLKGSCELEFRAQVAVLRAEFARLGNG